MDQSFNSLIWPTELQLLNKESLNYARVSKLNKFFGRLISVTRNTSIALAILYYLTFNYVLPNIEEIKKQRSALCIQNILKTRSLLKELDNRINAFNQSSVENHLLSVIQVDDLNVNVYALDKRIKKRNSSLIKDINELDNEVHLLTMKLNTSILS